MIESEDYIIRIVRLTFNEENIEHFYELYNKHKKAISSQSGCFSVELVEDSFNPNVVATISKWRDEESLNRYRDSKLFGVVWPATKELFAAKPEVWTYKARR